jgi:hypothetical protein
VPQDAFQGLQASLKIPPFLIGIQAAWVSVTVTMMSHFVTGGEDSVEGIRKGIGSVTGHEERSRDAVS